MRFALVGALLLTLTLAPPAHAACSGHDLREIQGPNEVWVSHWSCDRDPDERQDTVRVRSFWPFSPTSSATLVSVQSTSKVDHGPYDAYSRTDVLTVEVHGRWVDVRMVTNQNTEQQTWCTLTATVVGVGLRNTPMPACIHGAHVLP